MKKIFFLIFFLLSSFFITGIRAQIINTFAGNGTIGTIGDSSPATAAELKTPSGVAVDTAGNVYISDQLGNMVRKVNAAGIIVALAGNGTSGYSGDGGSATAAELNWPTGIITDHNGNVYIADQFNDVIRKVDTFGIISTIAGNGKTGYMGDNGPATAATLWHPADVGVDYAGNVYTVDQDNSAVRKISTAGIITTLAGNGTAGFGGDGGPATAALLNFPQGIAVDSAGDIFIADYYNSRIRKITAGTGIITTVAGNGTPTFGGDYGLATAASFAYASAVAIDRTGNIYITDAYSYKIRKVYANGIITTIAGIGTNGYSGDDGPATAAQISLTEGLAVNDSGNVFIADFNNAVVRIVTKIPKTISLTVLGLNTVSLSAFRVFPNPSSGEFTVQATDNNNEYFATVYNAIGEKIYQASFNSAQTKIDLSGRPVGAYILQIASGENIVVRRLLIDN